MYGWYQTHPLISWFPYFSSGKLEGERDRTDDCHLHRTQEGKFTWLCVNLKSLCSVFLFFYFSSIIFTNIWAFIFQLGATVEEGPDYCVITPPENLNVTAIDTYDDHRMAMAFSLAACGDVPVTIKDPGCTRKTFPDYFEVLQRFTKHWTGHLHINVWKIRYPCDLSPQPKRQVARPPFSFVSSLYCLIVFYYM